ncbi:MAG: cytochrome c [Colwellia sp.]|nr:cytochrome c [Colwellia sp.]
MNSFLFFFGIFFRTLFQKANFALPAFCLFFILSASATEAAATYQQCIACHGEQGQGNRQLKAPVLAGQSAKYLTRQLVNFKVGLRGSHEKDTLGKQMQVLSKQLVTNKDVTSVTAYLSKLPAVKISQISSGDLKNGSRYYQGKCGACHGGQAQGNPAFNAPKLSGQHSDYLKRQMLNFSTGIRGTHSDDKLGRQMAMMAKTTSGKELDDILHFIAMQD